MPSCAVHLLPLRIGWESRNGNRWRVLNALWESLPPGDEEMERLKDLLNRRG